MHSADRRVPCTRSFRLKGVCARSSVRSHGFPMAPLLFETFRVNLPPDSPSLTPSTAGAGIE